MSRGRDLMNKLIDRERMPVSDPRLCCGRCGALGRVVVCEDGEVQVVAECVGVEPVVRCFTAPHPSSEAAIQSWAKFWEDE